MVYFDDMIIMSNELLSEVNTAIDEVIKEKQYLDIDYDLLENILGKIVKSNIRIKDMPLSVITPIKKEEMIKISLDFFESIDLEIHKKAISTILQQTKNIKARIYNLHEVKDFRKKDETGLLEYTPDGTVQNKNGKATVTIPTKTELYPEEEKILDKDSCTLEDLYTVVHEIAHLFDLDLEKGKPEREELVGETPKRKISITRELLGEATSIAFEGMLSEYLLKNTSISEGAVQEMFNLRLNSSLRDIRLVYAKLLLAREKSKSGEITLKFIEEFMRNNNFSIQYVRRIAGDIIYDSRNMSFEKRYAIGGLIAPTIIKKYNEEGASILKKYLKQVKEDNFKGAFDTLGIELNEQGINQLIANMKEYSTSLNIEAR